MSDRLGTIGCTFAFPNGTKRRERTRPSCAGSRVTREHVHLCCWILAQLRVGLLVSDALLSHRISDLEMREVSEAIDRYRVWWRFFVQPFVSKGSQPSCVKNHAGRQNPRPMLLMAFRRVPRTCVEHSLLSGLFTQNCVGSFAISEHFLHGHYKETGVIFQASDGK